MNTKKRLTLIAEATRGVLRNPKRALGSLAKIGAERHEAHVKETFGNSRGLPTVDLLTLFGEFDEKIGPYTFLEGGSMVTDLALLRLLAQRIHGCEYFEIGAWRGESCSNLVEVTKRCVSLSLPPNEMRENDLDSRYIENDRLFTKDNPRIEHVGANSLNFDFKDYLGKFDLIFVDGDHSYEAVKKDSETAVELRRSNDSIIVWHDYMNTPERGINWDVLSGILDGLPLELHKKLYHVSNTLCAVLLDAHYPSGYLSYPSLPTKKFELTIKAIKV